MADIVGPTLEQLDIWSSSIDALAYSLDNSIWESAALREGAATLATAATVSAAGIKILVGAASVSVAATTSATGNRIALGSASLSTAATVAAAGGAIRTGGSSVSTAATTAAA